MDRGMCSGVMHLLLDLLVQLTTHIGKRLRLILAVRHKHLK